MLVDENMRYVWLNKDLLIGSNKYGPSSAPSFTVLLESVKPNWNVGKMDPVAILNLLDPFTKDNETISVNSKNQFKIACEDYTRANSLVESGELLMGGYKAFIPDSFLGKKGVSRLFSVTRSVEDIVSLIRRDVLLNIISIKRSFDNNNEITEKVEFTFNFVPDAVSMDGLIHRLTPAVPRLRRCFMRQIFDHAANQCRSTYPAHNFCSGKRLRRFFCNGN